MNIDNNKPKAMLRLTLSFYEEEAEPNTFGNNNVVYEIIYFYGKGIMNVERIDCFGDRVLKMRFLGKRGRGITEDEMLKYVKELSSMTYKEFKEKVWVTD